MLYVFGVGGRFESTEHLFLQCPFIQCIWTVILDAFGIRTKPAQLKTVGQVGIICHDQITYDLGHGCGCHVVGDLA